MTSNEGITQSGADSINGIVGTPFLAHATTSAFLDSEEDVYFYGTGDKIPNRKGVRQSSSPLNRGSKESRITQETSYVFRKNLEEAKIIAKTLALAAKEDNIIKKSNIAFDLVDRLEVLWELRNHHVGDNWRDILNHLQGVLVKQKFELLTAAMCTGIEQIVGLLLQSNVAVSDLRDALEILSRSGLNAWRPISGVNTDEVD